MSRVALPYNLQEGTVAYAMKVMANFRALLGIYNNVSIPGLGEGDVDTMLKLLAEAMVKAGVAGNTDKIVFPDGETVTQKFNAGTLNASLLDSDGLFYLTVGSDGHLYVTASDSVNAEQFSIDRQPSSETYGHLLYTLTDPEPGGAVHTYDLGSVIGPAGPSGTGDMAASVYDPNGQHKDVNMYVGHFNCPAAGWGSYFLTTLRRRRARPITPTTARRRPTPPPRWRKGRRCPPTPIMRSCPKTSASSPTSSGWAGPR